MNQQINIMSAVRIYYEKIEIGNQDIMKIFGVSSTTATNMKRSVRKSMAEQNKKCMFRGNVNTKIAFETWGLDIADLEKRAKKIKEYT